MIVIYWIFVLLLCEISNGSKHGDRDEEIAQLKALVRKLEANMESTVKREIRIQAAGGGNMHLDQQLKEQEERILDQIKEQEKRINSNEEAIVQAMAAAEEKVNTTLEYWSQHSAPSGKVGFSAKGCESVYNGMARLNLPGHTKPLLVKCYKGGIVIQSRGQFGNPEDYFDRDWNSYKKGFGDPAGEVWIGLDNIHFLTTCGYNQLRISMTGSGKYNGKKQTAIYDWFSISGPNHESPYKMSVASEISDPADEMTGSSLFYFRDTTFMTKDNKNRDCVNHIENGGWWCGWPNYGHTNLNGLNVNSGDTIREDGIIWQNWRTDEDGKLKYHNPKEVIMSVHQKNFGDYLQSSALYAD